MTEWINYHGLNRHLFVPPTQGPRPMTDADRIKELEARVAELEDMASRYLIQMSDILTRLKERHPEDFVWLKEGDEPTAEDAYGWGCQGWGDPR